MKLVIATLFWAAAVTTAIASQRGDVESIEAYFIDQANFSPTHYEQSMSINGCAVAVTFGQFKYDFLISSISFEMWRRHIDRHFAPLITDSRLHYEAWMDRTHDGIPHPPESLSMHGETNLPPGQDSRWFDNALSNYVASVLSGEFGAWFRYHHRSRGEMRKGAWVAYDIDMITSVPIYLTTELRPEFIRVMEEYSDAYCSRPPVFGRPRIGDGWRKPPVLGTVNRNEKE